MNMEIKITDDSPLINYLRELHERASPAPWQMHITQHSPDNDLLSITLRNITPDLLELLEAVAFWYKTYQECNEAYSLCSDEAYPHERDAEIEQSGKEYDLAVENLLLLAKKLYTKI